MLNYVGDWVNWFFGLLTPAQWDAWRNALTAIVGLIALSIAVGTYRRNVRIKREEQARAVYSKVTHAWHYATGDTFPIMPYGAQLGFKSEEMDIIRNSVRNAEDPDVLGRALAPLNHATVVIHNGSKELIGPARVQMVNGGDGKIWDEFSLSVDAVDPESNFVVDFTWLNEFHPGQPSLATTVIFRDASGQWWRRHRAEPIERVHDDPENQGATATQRAHIRSAQIAAGLEPPPEPKVTWRVRWHRFWRRRAGKSALP